MLREALRSRRVEAGTRPAASSEAAVAAIVKNFNDAVSSAAAKTEPQATSVKE